MTVRIFLMILCGLFHILLATASAKEVGVAVAANFQSTLNAIAIEFERATGHTALISSGSSGKFFAQIQHGAPFDVFFSADVTRPKLLAEAGLAVPDSRFTYAVGRLTLWSPNSNMLKHDGPTVLSHGQFTHLAIANPKTAPYGGAAEQTLKKLGLWNHVKDRIVRGENIGQTFHFVFSENAQLGFVARAQVVDPKINGVGSHWNVPADLHEPIRQQAVLLVHGQENEAAKTFLHYVQGPQARMIIKKFGYGLE